jgi:peptide/nickel transport system permease protein
MAVGVLAVSVAMIAGSVIGIMSSYYGGAVDGILMRLIDAIWSIPLLALVLGVVAVLGRSLEVIIAVVGVGFMPIFARLAAAQTKVVLSQEYVTAARMLGARDTRIMARHIAPNILNLLTVQAATLMSTAIVVEAGLSFLGAGVRPPQATWGGMLRDAYGHLELAPTVALFPALAITLLVVSLNIVSDAFRDWLDPRHGRLIPQNPKAEQT